MVAGTHGSTYGGNPLAMAVGNAVLDIMLAPGFLEHVQEMGDLLQARLAALMQKHSVITEVRGKGLMVGIRVPSMPTRDIVSDLISRGMLPAVAGDMVVRMLPPLIVEESHIDEAMQMLDAAFTEYSTKAD
jgi:acetylornithine/N-succinyldiaminopimelate aminotransferase